MSLRYQPTDGLERRYKRLSISGAVLLDIFRGMDGIRRVRAEGLPKDARTIGITLDERFDTVVLYIESAEFQEVPAGAIPGDLDIRFTEYSGDAYPAMETTDAPGYRTTGRIPRKALVMAAYPGSDPT